MSTEPTPLFDATCGDHADALLAALTRPALPEEPSELCAALEGGGDGE